MINYIKSLFNKDQTTKTVIHPDYKTLIEKVKVIKGRQLYKFKSLLDMPHNRYNKATRFISEFDMRLDSKILKKSFNEIKDLFNKILESEDLPQTRRSARKGLNLEETLSMHLDMLVGIEASFRLVSCAWFWEDEDLDDYDFEIGDEKITLFKEEKLESFFLSKPMKDFIPQMNLSAQDLNAFSQYEKELKKLLSKQLKNENGKKEKTTS